MNDNLYQGIVKDAEFAQILPEVSISLLDSRGNNLCQTNTDSHGAWALSCSSEGVFLLFTKPGFVSKTISTSKTHKLVRLLEDRLVGYQDRLWFYPGDEVPVFVHSPNVYSATLFRHGNVKERIHAVQNLSSQQQSIPDGLFVENGLTWEQSFCHSIPEDAIPGLYSLLLESRGQKPFAIPMIVSTPKNKLGKNNLLVLANTNTWLAYNIWGGRSRYLNYEQTNNVQSNNLPSWSIINYIVKRIKKVLPFGVVVLLRQYFNTNKEKTFPWMLKRLSIRRPFSNCDLESDSWELPFTNHLAGGEWRVLAWLEKMKYSYDIISGWELNHDPGILGAYKALLLSTHCEYWSCAMFDSVNLYHQTSGLWILNLSGNTMYREVELFEDGSIRCANLSFKESCADESQITGVRFTDYDYGTCASFKVVDHSHWVFNDSGVSKNGQLFGKYSLNQHTISSSAKIDPGRPSQGEGLVGQGASGWETDKLSATASQEFNVIASGLNPYGGADIVVLDPRGSKGGVLSAPSIVFGGSLVVDPVCAKLVENVLNKCLDE